MSEIAKCPVCGNVQIEVLNEHNMPDGAYCCGVHCASIKKWNQYAAAMESQKELAALREAVAWERECEEVKRLQYELWELAPCGSGYMEIYSHAVAIYDAARAEVDRLLDQQP